MAITFAALLLENSSASDDVCNRGMGALFLLLMLLLSALCDTNGGFCFDGLDDAAAVEAVFDATFVCFGTVADFGGAFCDDSGIVAGIESSGLVADAAFVVATTIEPMMGVVDVGVLFPVLDLRRITGGSLTETSSTDGTVEKAGGGGCELRRRGKSDSPAATPVALHVDGCTVDSSVLRKLSIKGSLRLSRAVPAVRPKMDFILCLLLLQ